MKETKVIVLAGFLGSGKTTLLQQLLAYLKEQNKSYAVVMNEIGDRSIDTELVGKDTPVSEILNGCICCSSKEQFDQAIMSTVQSYHPDYLFVECSGVSHPYEVIDSVTNPLIAHQVNFLGTLTTLDAPRFLTLQDQDPQLFRLMYEQAVYANLVIITKSEQLDPIELLKFNEQIQSLPIESTLQRNPKVLLEKIEHYKPYKTTAEEMDVDHLHIDTFRYTFTHPIDQTDFEHWLQQLDNCVLRVKGFLTFNHQPKTCYLFQYAFGVPLYQPYDMNPKHNLVIIGKHLDKDKLLLDMQQLDEIDKNM